MSESSSFQEYKEYALKTGRETAFFEEALQGYENRRQNLHKRTVVLYDDRGLSLISFSDPSLIMNKRMFSGIFFSCNINTKSTFTVVKRDIFNTLSFSRRNKTGNIFVDTKVKAEGNDTMLMSQVFHSYKVQNAVLDIFKIDQRIIFGLNSLNLDFVSVVEFKSAMGFYVRQDWLFDYEKLNMLFAKAKIIKEEMDAIFSANP